MAQHDSYEINVWSFETQLVWFYYSVLRMSGIMQVRMVSLFLCSFSVIPFMEHMEEHGPNVLQENPSISVTIMDNPVLKMDLSV